MLEADTDLKTAGQILGHGSVGQTSKYTHILADRKRAAVARIETLLWGSDCAQAFEHGGGQNTTHDRFVPWSGRSASYSATRSQPACHTGEQPQTLGRLQDRTTRHVV